MFRFAVSPVKDIDINTLRVALFNYILSSQKHDKLHIRIEDMDTKKNIDGKDQEILEILSLFGITWSEVNYQSHNLKFHQQLATKLLMDKNAYSCFCTEDDITKAKEKAKQKKIRYQYDGTCENLSDEEVLNNEMPFTIRVKRPNQDINFHDKIKGDINFKKESIDSFVILKVDKTPTYNFASALDDMLSDISMVIKDDRELLDTPQQILIRDYLGYDKSIEYAHIYNILNEPTTTTNKQDNISSVKWLLEEGYLPSSITNYLILIGNKTPTEIFSLDEAKEWFDLKNISDNTEKFNLSKLKDINKEHIKNLPPKELAKFLSYSSSDLGELAKIYTKECSTINEIKPKIDAIFAKKEPLKFVEDFKKLQDLAKVAPFFKEYDEFKNHLLKESKLKDENFFKILRFLLTGAEDGPNLSDIYPHIKNYLGEIIR